jgi:hypothetical protein
MPIKPICQPKGDNFFRFKSIPLFHKKQDMDWWVIRFNHWEKEVYLLADFEYQIAGKSGNNGTETTPGAIRKGAIQVNGLIKSSDSPSY